MNEISDAGVVFVVKAIKHDPDGGNDWYQLGPEGTYGQRAPRKNELLKPADLGDALAGKK